MALDLTGVLMVLKDIFHLCTFSPCRGGINPYADFILTPFE